MEYTCIKCNGSGKIEGFSHISSGICFSCKGTGLARLTRSKKSVNDFKLSFRTGKGYFDENLLPEGSKRLKCIGFEDHPTAQIWVYLTPSGEVYVGQPICQASGWSYVPKEFAEKYLECLG